MSFSILAMLRTGIDKFIERQVQRGARLSLSEIPRDAEAAEAHLREAVAKVEAGDHAAAEQSVRESLSFDLGNADAHLFLGRLLAARGVHEDAARCLEQAARFSPLPGPLWAELGMLHAKHDRTDAAIDALAKGLTLDPRQPEPAATLASLFEARGDRAEAQRYFKLTLDEDPTNALARAGVSRLKAPPVD